MTRAELLALAERVEKAKGPDRELDYAVAAAAGWPDSPIMKQNARRYTESLDAALTLVEQSGAFIAKMGDIAADGLPGVFLCTNTDPVREVWGVGHGHDYIGKFARAATAAALRALAEAMRDE